MLSGLLSHVSQRVTDALVDARHRSRLSRVVLHSARRVLVRAGDPLIRYRLGDSELLLPLSHDLPHYCAEWPLYNANLGHVAKQISERVADFTVVDIGANVGDSAAVIRNEVTAPILCVEGNDAYLPVLRRNLSRVGGEIEVAACFVGRPTTGEVHSQHGTARIVPTSAGTTLAMKSLRDILADHPRFARAKLVKIDTDGFDCGIIRDNLATLRDMRSIIFFEYAPKLTRLIGDTCEGLLEQLRAAGYRHALLYDNVGALLLGMSLDNQSAVRDIEHYFACREDVYADICVFLDEDEAIFEAIRQVDREPGTGTM
jgi:FkbM family methyltransferase